MKSGFKKYILAASLVSSIFIFVISVYASRTINCDSDFSSCSGLVGHWEFEDDQYDDTFSSTLDTNRWSPYASNGSNANTSGYLRQVCNGGSSCLVYVRSQNFTGDFDVQVEYNLVTFPYTSASNVDLFVNGLPGKWNRIQRYRTGGGEAIKTNSDSGEWSSVGLGFTGSSEGKFRITRAGNTFTYYYWKDSSYWQQLGTPQTDSDIGSTIQIDLRTETNDSNPALDIHFDNFIVNKGEQVTDSSINSNDGMLNGSALSGNGVVGNALSFDGTNGYVDLGNDSIFNIANAITLSSWIKINALGVDHVIIDKGNNTSNGVMKLWIWGGANLLFFDAPEGTIRISGAPAGGFQTGQWYHVAATYNKNGGSNNLNLYINGVNVASATDTDTMGTNSYKLSLGANAQGTDGYIDGAIDDVSIWNRAFNSTEVGQLYNIGASPISSTTLFTGTGTTDFSAVSNMSSIPSMKLATATGSIQWTNNVNAANQDYDSNIRIGTGYVSINKASLHSTIDTAARVSVGVSNCGLTTIYYATGYRSSLADIKANGQVCNSGTTPACTNISCSGGVLSFDVPHFDGYGGEGGEAPPDDEGLPTTLNIENVPPSFTAGPSDGPSSATTPTNAGSDVTFTATAHDNNADQYYLAICKNGDAPTPGTDGPPTCNGGAGNNWAISEVANSDAPASVTYTTSSGNVESNAWYAFVCDKNTAGLCSLSSQGTGDDGSPFNVNHRPIIGTKTVTDTGNGSIQPGETVKFSAVATDPDIVTAGDTIKMTVCSGDADMGGVTTAFVPGETPACTGGTVLCSSDFVASGATATCNDTTSLVSIPTAHGTYNVKIYLQDNHYFTDDGTANAKTYNVTDVVPTLDSYIATDTPTPSAGGSDTTNFSVALIDDNGDNDVTNIKGVFFDPAAVQNDCTADQNDCYIHTSCTPTGVSSAGTGKTATGTDKNLGANCTVTVFFNANGSNWDVEAKATDGNGVTPFANAGVLLSVPSLSGIDVVETEIAYGTIVIGGTSPGKAISLGNVGNGNMDILVQGTNMCIGTFAESCPSTYIPISSQKWHMDDINFDWDSSSGGDGPYPLVAASSTTSGNTGCANEMVRQRDNKDSSSETNQNVYWKMRIPEGQIAGSYFGQVVLASTVQCVQEVCNNSTDDNDNGLIDCADHRACDLSPYCTALDLPMTQAAHDTGNNRSLDSSANASHAVFGNGSTASTFPTKLYKDGYSFDGGDWLQVADSNSLDITDEFTMALWIKVNTIPTDYQAVVEKANTNADASYMFYITPTTAKFRPHIYDAQTNDWVYGDTSLSLTPGVWYHFVYTYKSSTGELKAYVDATEATISNWYRSPVAGHTIKVSNSPLYIGKDTRGEMNLNGSVADVKIYNYAMGLKQIQRMYLEKFAQFK